MNHSDVMMKRFLTGRAQYFVISRLNPSPTIGDRLAYPVGKLVAETTRCAPFGKRFFRIGPAGYFSFFSINAFEAVPIESEI